LQGYTSKEIGKKLEISNRTVEFYISNLKQKLKFRKISELFSIIHPSSQMSLVE
jgi:DNA-binding NarL/FixJ family response regulator